jgi:prepilin-type N-terminal cleavage/methylation domain-containing protein/prepilin-type processing-associated H-X9-DG protein
MSTARSFRQLKAGFTLIELLVVIAIIGVLISILLPSLGRARALGRQTREMSGARQLMTAFSMYADTYRGRVLPGYPPAPAVNNANIIDSDGNAVTNEEAQRYPWRIAPFLGDSLAGLYADTGPLNDFRTRRAEYESYGVTLGYMGSLYPSMGMNIAFIGGSDRHQQYSAIFNNIYGRVAIERVDQVQRTSELMVFASARSEAQPAIPVIGKGEGFFRLEPPVYTQAQGRRWGAAAYDETTETAGLNSGFVSLRHGKKAIMAMIDGHAQTGGWDTVRDMRYWADAANSPDWGIRPR